MVYCEECYKSKFGPDYLPPSIGRSTCEECGHSVQDAYENEDDNEDE